MSRIQEIQIPPEIPVIWNLWKKFQSFEIYEKKVTITKFNLVTVFLKMKFQNIITDDSNICYDQKKFGNTALNSLAVQPYHQWSLFLV